jgi:hypothetical protein
LALLAVLALAPQAGFAAVPETINYQGTLSDPAGVPINASVDMTFTLYSDAGGASPTGWAETHTGVTVTNGLFNVTLGAVVPLNLADFDNPAWLGIKVGADPEMTPLQAITSVGYALRAKGAEAAVLAVVSLDVTCTACVAATELDFDTATQAELDAHGVAVDAHHTRYTDAEAVTAVGPHTADTLTGLSCAPNQVAAWSGAAWACAADADTDTQLNETQVEGFVTNGIIDLFAGSTVGGQSIMTGSTVDWASLTNVPADIADGDNDTLGGVTGCTNGQVAKSDGAGGWACAADVDTDTNTGVTGVNWVAGTPTAVGASATVTATAGCGGGEVAIGGGFQADSEFVYASGSYPDTAANPATAWNVDAYNTDITGRNVTAYVICVTP